MVGLPGGQLPFHVSLLSQACVQLEYSAFQLGGELLELLERNGQLVDLEFQLGAHFFHDARETLNLHIFQLAERFH